MTQPLISSQSQRLNLPAIATAGANGAATFIFAPPPNGFTFTGTLNCGAAPASAVFTAAMVASGDATTAGVPWGQWGGNSVYGPVQAWPPESLVVTATGLTAGTQYQLVWLGSVDPLGTAAAISPGANASALLGGLINSQGVFDVLTIGSGTAALAANIPANLGGIFGTTALHNYAALLLLGTYSVTAQVKCQAIRNPPGGGFDLTFPPVTLVSNGGAGSVNPVDDSVAMPFACLAGDQANVKVTASANGTLTYSIFGLTVPLVQQVITPPGNPLETHQVGGTLQASHTFAGAGNFTVLAAPVAGMAYRLHRFAATANINIFGVTSGFFYGGSNGTTFDTLMGQIVTEGIQFSAVAAGTGYLSYDLIAQPTLI